MIVLDRRLAPATEIAAYALRADSFGTSFLGLASGFLPSPSAPASALQLEGRVTVITDTAAFPLPRG